MRQHRQRRAAQHNMRFMWGAIAMALVVLSIAALFLEWSMK